LAPLVTPCRWWLAVTFVLMLPWRGLGDVKRRLRNDGARVERKCALPLGYSIYYTLVNIGGALGPYIATGCINTERRNVSAWRRSRVS